LSFAIKINCAMQKETVFSKLPEQPGNWHGGWVPFILMFALLMLKTTAGFAQKGEESKYLQIVVYPITDRTDAVREVLTHQMKKPAAPRAEQKAKEEQIIKIKALPKEEVKKLEAQIAEGRFEEVEFDIEAARPETVERDFELSDPAERAAKGRPKDVTHTLACDPAKEECVMIGEDLAIQPNYCPAHEMMTVKLRITPDGQYQYNDGHPIVGEEEAHVHFPEGYKPITEVTFYYQAKKNGLVIEGMSLKAFSALTVEAQRALLDGVMEVMQVNQCFPPEYFADE